jgi:hypothetical protein
VRSQIGQRRNDQSVVVKFAFATRTSRVISAVVTLGGVALDDISPIAASCEMLSQRKSSRDGRMLRLQKGVLISDTFRALDFQAEGRSARGSLMFRSLQGRLIVLLVLLVAAAGAAGALMVGLFRQSATAQAGKPKPKSGGLAMRSAAPTDSTAPVGRGPLPDPITTPYVGT